MLITKEKQAQCQKNLYDYLRQHAEENGDRAYLITEDGTMTYAEALRVVQSLATEFLHRGMKKGDLVALRTTRSADTALLTVALCAVGATAVTTDAHFGVKEYVQNSGVEICPNWWLTNERANGGLSASGNWELEQEGGKTATLELVERGISLDELNEVSAKVQAEDPCMIIFTSGSTGKSKAVVLSHRAVIANPVDAMPLFEEDDKDVAISVLPLNHVFGFAVVTCATFCGHPVVFPATTDVDVVLGCIQKHHVSIIYSVPTFFLGLLSDGKNKDYDISSLRLGLMAGGPFTEKQLRFIEGELGIELMPGYGMSECVGVSTMSYGDPVGMRAAGVGRLYPMTEAFILDEDGAVLGVGETGEICVRGMTMMSGYYHNEEETKAMYDEENRLHTGDLGYFDGDGILHVSGRKKDLIIRGGENISTVKIEKALLAVDGVYQTVAVGVADEKFGEVPCAAVILQKGVTLTEEQIGEALKDLLSKHELPTKILIMESFPLTSSGKPQKSEIKKLF